MTSQAIQRPNLYRRMLSLGALATLGLHEMGLAETARQKPTIALITKSLNKQFGRTMLDGAIDYQKHNANDFNLVTDGIPDDSDATAQISIVRAMIELKVNAIVLAPVDSKVLIPVVAAAIGSAIIVITIDNELDDDALRSLNLNVPFVGPNDRKGAKLVGDYVASKLTRDDEVGIITGPVGDVNSQRRTAGLSDAVQAHGLRIIAVASGKWETASAAAVAAGMLHHYPGIKALLCSNDPMAIGAVSALQAAQITRKVYVSGYDNTDVVRRMLKDGSVLATADHFPAKQGIFGVDIALKAVVERRKQADLTRFFETPVQLVGK